MSARYDMDAVKDGLRTRLSDMIHDRLSHARRQGNRWFVGSLHNDTGNSLCIWTDASGCGAWKDFSSGEKGDVLSLYAHLYHGSDTIDRAIIDAAAAFAGVSGEPFIETEADRARLAAQKETRARRDAAKRQAEADKQERKRRYYFSLWLKAHRCQPGDPVWSYLEGRGIDAPSLTVKGSLPGAVRYSPGWPFWRDGREYHYPAMISQLMGKLADGSYACLAVHATYLERAQNGQWRARFDGKDKRRVFGAAKGSIIPLWKAGTGTSFTKARRETLLILCEGVEDGLTLAMACPDAYVAAAYSLTNLRNLQSPSVEGFGEVVIAADNDWGKPANAAQVRAARDRIIRSGRDCRVIHSTVGKDFNDHLQAVIKDQEGVEA